MDAEQARRELTDERRRLVELGSWSREQAPQPAAEHEGALGQHSADYGSDVEEAMEDQGLADETERQVAEIDDALARIEAGSWGTCVVCGRPIDDERLEARPQAARCREHQEELERTGR